MTPDAHTDAGPDPALTISIVSDVVCPWCYVGKRRLEAALVLYRERFPDRPAPVVNWWPFQLNPDLPTGGVSRAEHLAGRFDPSTLEEMHVRLRAIGGEVGIDFNFEGSARLPNTLAAHGLIALAAGHGLQEEMVEALFQAYFVDGADLTKPGALAAIAAAVGLPAPMIEECLSGNAMRQQMAGQDRQARELGVQGVPFFIFNNRLAVSGAHPPEALLGAMIEAQQEPAEA